MPEKNALVYYEQGRYLAAGRNEGSVILLFGYSMSGPACRNSHVTSAVAKLDHAIELNPRYAEALLLRGVIYGHFSEKERAHNDMGDAIRLTQDGGFGSRAKEECLLARATYYCHVKQLHEAAEDYSSLIQASLYSGTSSYCQHLAERAALYVTMAEYDKAIADLTAAIQAGPRAGEDGILLACRWTDRGDACDAKGDCDEAVVSYNRAIQTLNEFRADWAKGPGWAKERDARIAKIHKKLVCTRQKAGGLRRE